MIMTQHTTLGKIIESLELTPIETPIENVELLSEISDLGYPVLTTLRGPNFVLVSSGFIQAEGKTATEALANLHGKIIKNQVREEARL